MVAAVGVAATAVWLRRPPNVTNGSCGACGWKMASIKATASFLGQNRINHPSWAANEQRRVDDIQRRKDKVYALGDARSLTQQAIGVKPTPTEIIKDAGIAARMANNGDNMAHVLWRVCSAVAHSDM